MAGQHDPIVESIVREACLGLFQDYSLPLRPATATELATDTDSFLYCGTLGFSGSQARGTLMLATSQEALGRTIPTGDAPLREWIAELSNQLLGRIKSRLLRRGIAVYVSTPVVFRGKHLAPLPRVDLEPFAFASGDSLVCVWLDLELAPGLRLSELPEASEVLDEGTGLMF